MENLNEIPTTVGELFTLIEAAYAKMQDSREKAISFTAYENAKIIITLEQQNASIKLHNMIEYKSCKLFDLLKQLEVLCSNIYFPKMIFKEATIQQLAIALARAWNLKEK